MEHGKKGYFKNFLHDLADVFSVTWIVYLSFYEVKHPFI